MAQNIFAAIAGAVRLPSSPRGTCPSRFALNRQASLCQARGTALTLALGLVAILIPAGVRAQTETVLHGFTGVNSTPRDGAAPYDSLLVDSSGNLFGTTTAGGASGLGTVFELVNSSGSYTEKVLYSFTGAAGDGATPYGRLVMDASGNLYGTTQTGGSSGSGTVFELVNSSGTYAENVLYAFPTTGTNGANPYSGLVMDSSGNLYGTTDHGGASGLGTVFELLNSSGSYTEKVLYSFTGTNGDGKYPDVAGLILDSSGNLYGTTLFGGAANAGTVFELAKSSGSYLEQVLYSFTGTGSDGKEPDAAGLVMDSAGDLYGTTLYGGASGLGTVFELVNSSGTYTEKILHGFTGTGTDGADPYAQLVLDSSGDLYGTTSLGGGTAYLGTIFELVNSSGTYTEKVLYSFTGGAGDGEYPYAGMTMDLSGNFYGTTIQAGPDNFGVVFKFVPVAGPKVSFSPSPLAFGSVPVGSPSTAKSVTVTNNGSAGLVFAASAVTLAGSNAADFAISTDTCSGATVAPKSTCAVSLVFTPSLAASESAALSFADNAAGSPQVVNVTGSGVTAPAVTLSPASLAFPSQAMGTTSAAQTVTLTNTGGVNLTFSAGAVSISGGDAADFAMATDTCSGQTVAPSHTCTVGVAFDPSLAGSESATLSIADNAANSPQTVGLSGTGVKPDFRVSVSGSSSATVTAGGNASYSISISPSAGFNQSVALACTGAPAKATCSISPASPTLDGSSTVTASVSVTTTASSGVPPYPTIPLGWLGLMMVALLALLAWAAIAKDRGGQKSKARKPIAAAAGLLLAGALLASCSSSAGNPTPQTVSGTPAGTYTLTVTGTSGSLAHSVQLTLTVN